MYKPGTGLTGIVCALAGAGEVIISDYPSRQILDNLNVNIEKNVPDYIRNKDLHLHQTLWYEGALERAKIPFSVDGESINLSSQGSINVYSHKWGCLTDQPAQSHEKYFTRIIAADCLWMLGEHENLVQSMLHFLSCDEDARVWVIAGFHSGRANVAAFFDTAAEMGLGISQIYERDVNGAERAWKRERDGGHEDVTERKRWLVIAILQRNPLSTGVLERKEPSLPRPYSEWRESTATLTLPNGMGNSTTTLVP